MEAKTPKTLGHVSLIGAGPGAADLITVRGARLLGEAEVVLHDALVSPEVFQYCPQAVLIAVGKRCGKRSTAQRFINRQLVDLATKYQRVVRLKGGDPMLFGRADEELQALEQAGIDYEVVPGITAALAAASAIRQPLTKRGVARSVAFVTQAKATDPDTPQPEGAVPEPVAQADSLVYYMGRDQAASIAADLIARGRAPSTPAWVVEAATTPEQRSACFTLQQMANGAAAEWINAEHPSLLMIGDALAVRASAAASEPALDAHPHSLAA
ncbi:MULTISPECIES: uroporphyrinogen-III C-methyltransferase [Ralstonia]|uniref:uroporphyrinogen-III C-methyltransferase n=3 Tax=Ralstonia TaxID=48736 RepID=A0AAD2F5N5_9RALS|nr:MULTISPECIES: uroporphyrinogen-III C-methyltransferase [Ralstonia]MBE3031747.1 uroporphyrinogen-III C-methyltransferase [Actinomycetota bacterium]MEA3271612.1 uroporphyrinogen-III C-methyltransferase [Pseudomonadota bacterium]EFP65603.1 uroporphyrinogen-III C-methyltransferase [Ralstonia pickettii]EGY66417.1 uroporphyrinogen-III C-methyltransferase [Ralstonia sp. 5_2_56FAA]ENZ77009.1 uroporphyrinogen-III C-methyltransferase [Ralstonia pickettii OR214]